MVKLLLQAGYKTYEISELLRVDTRTVDRVRVKFEEPPRRMEFNEVCPQAWLRR